MEVINAKHAKRNMKNLKERTEAIGAAFIVQNHKRTALFFLRNIHCCLIEINRILLNSYSF